MTIVCFRSNKDVYIDKYTHEKSEVKEEISVPLIDKEPKRCYMIKSYPAKPRSETNLLSGVSSGQQQ